MHPFDRPSMSEPLVFSDDIKIFSRNAKRSIFVRDLPYCCTSADLGDFFAHSLNTPVLHAMVCRNKQGRTLQIGYVLFQSEEAVRVALDTMNGRRFIGRDIRVLPYDPKAPSEPSTTGLVHVSFKTLTAQHPLVTEATIRRAFEIYGELEHVAIRTHKYTDTALQGGYGFVTFRRPDLNRYVIEQVRQIEVGGVLYDCSWSSLHTHKGATGEEIVIDPRYGYLATKTPSSNSAPSSVGLPPSSRSMGDAYGLPAAYGAPAASRGAGGRDRPYPGYPEYDEYYGGRRDPREDPHLRGYDYDRRVPPRPGYAQAPSLPTPPPRAYYDEPAYYDEFYRGARSHTSGRAPFAGNSGPIGHGPLYDRGYYEESYRGSVPAARYPNAYAPRPAMSARDHLDMPYGAPLPGDDRYALTGARSMYAYERQGSDLFGGGGGALPPRSSLLGDADPMAAGNPLGGSSAAYGLGPSRRSVDSMGAATDVTDFSFDLGRVPSGPVSSLSASAYDFYPNVPNASSGSAGFDGLHASERPSRSSWETDLPSEFTRGNSEFSRLETDVAAGHGADGPMKPADGVFKPAFRQVDPLDALIDEEPTDDAGDDNRPLGDEEGDVVPHNATFNGPPGLKSQESTTATAEPQFSLLVQAPHDGPEDSDSVPPHRDGEVLDSFTADFASKAVIQ